MKFLYIFLFISVIFAQETNPTFTCGTGLTCTYVTAEFKLKIEGTGVMKNFTKTSVPWSSYSDTITMIEIAEGVQHIGDYAFYKTEKLESIAIPNSVVSIGKNAFRECSKLKQITFGSSPQLKVIGDNSFHAMGTHYYTQEYKGPAVTIELTFPASLETVNKSAFESSNVNIITFNGVKTIGKNAFAYSCCQYCKYS